MPLNYIRLPEFSMKICYSFIVIHHNTFYAPTRYFNNTSASKDREI